MKTREPDDPEFYRRLLDSLSEGVYFTDIEGKVVYWNKAAGQLTGYSTDEVLGRYCHDGLIVHTDEQGHPLCQTPHCLAKLVMNDDTPREQLVYLRHRDGHRLPVLARTSPMYDPNGRLLGVVELISDASRAQMELQHVEALEAAALLDPLTEISNRRHAEMILRDKLATYERHGLGFGVFFVDVDHFKTINDTHGHETGDAVLRMVASTLHHGIRDSDFVARWGGEEFLVILAGCFAEELSEMAEKLRRLVETSALPTETEGIRVTVSIGAAAVPPAAANPAEIVARADALMYEAKKAGRNRVGVEGGSVSSNSPISSRQEGPKPMDRVSLTKDAPPAKITSYS